ncbi:hypothetical protein RFI_20987 [Reticulomyxa filosa]|uniref:Tectonic domain-containing protein n=1 Tax=Reticulomyxa filosa TaxID=46433 RepID=X6MQW5_RETFI|nr:hypothetical protein RFI_20987 [Reticulomyxa filosa]|eukprot:ETO16363.1 hypothetical protein RFI_20987 [Reticulomyxa filosa]
MLRFKKKAVASFVWKKFTWKYVFATYSIIIYCFSLVIRSKQKQQKIACTTYLVIHFQTANAFNVTYFGNNFDVFAGNFYSNVVNQSECDINYIDRDNSGKFGFGITLNCTLSSCCVTTLLNTFIYDKAFYLYVSQSVQEIGGKWNSFGVSSGGKPATKYAYAYSSNASSLLAPTHAPTASPTHPPTVHPFFNYTADCTWEANSSASAILCRFIPDVLFYRIYYSFFEVSSAICESLFKDDEETLLALGLGCGDTTYGCSLSTCEWQEVQPLIMSGDTLATHVNSLRIVLSENSHVVTDQKLVFTLPQCQRSDGCPDSYSQTSTHIRRDSVDDNFWDTRFQGVLPRLITESTLAVLLSYPVTFGNCMPVVVSGTILGGLGPTTTTSATTTLIHAFIHAQVPMGFFFNCTQLDYCMLQANATADGSKWLSIGWNVKNEWNQSANISELMSYDPSLLVTPSITGPLYLIRNQPTLLTMDVFLSRPRTTHCQCISQNSFTNSSRVWLQTLLSFQWNIEQTPVCVCVYIHNAYMDIQQYDNICTYINICCISEL